MRSTSVRNNIIINKINNLTIYTLDQTMPSLTTPHVNELILQENKVKIVVIISNINYKLFCLPTGKWSQPKQTCYSKFGLQKLYYFIIMTFTFGMLRLLLNCIAVVLLHVHSNIITMMVEPASKDFGGTQMGCSTI